MARIPEAIVQKVRSLYIAEASALLRKARMLRQGDRASADDLVQQVFHDAATADWAKLDELSDEGRRRWLFTVLQRRAIDQWRREQRETLDLEVLDEYAFGCMDDLADLVVSDLSIGQLWQELRSMPPRQYRVAYLAFHEGWDNQRIAEAMGIKAVTARVHKHDALAYIRKVIENLDGEGWLR